ncbi:MAG: hypothetical protein J6M14_01385 [Campylobacter sp.]|nr:hypothetical protein [Campylobacter sp.]
MKKSIFGCAIIALLVSGCGYVKKPFVNEASLLDRAELATGVEKSNLTLVKDSVVSEIDSVHFKVNDNKGNLYRCYFTSVVAVDSDTLCTKIGGTKDASNQKCNALLKKAGKC